MFEVTAAHFNAAEQTFVPLMALIDGIIDDTLLQTRPLGNQVSAFELNQVKYWSVWSLDRRIENALGHLKVVKTGENWG